MLRFLFKPRYNLVSGAAIGVFMAIVTEHGWSLGVVVSLIATAAVSVIGEYKYGGD